MKLRRQLLTLIPVAALTCSSLAAAANGLPWRSDFENGNSNTWNGDRNGNVVVVDGGADGSLRAARVALQAGTLNDHFIGHHFGDFVTEGGDKVEEVWLRMYSKFSGDVRWPNRQSHKIAIFNITDGNSWQRRYQAYLYVTPSGRYAVDVSDIGSWDFVGLEQNVGNGVGVRLNQWDKLKLRVKLNQPGRSDGIVQLWVNDQLKLDHRNVDIRGNSTYGLNKLILSSYTSDESGGGGMQWYDDWSLSTSDPDAGRTPPTAGRGRPQPPTLRLEG